MYILIIICLIVVTITIWSFLDERSIGLSFLMFILTTALLVLLYAMISEVYIDRNRSEFTMKPKVEVNRVNIKTLQDETGNISGRFSLGSGIIQNESYYYFYIVENDSTSYLKKLNSEYVKIVETDLTNPCVVKYETEIDWENTPQRNWLLHIPNKSFRYNWIIYVPKNTIIVNYNLDTK